MNLLRTNRPNHLVLIAVALVTILGATACGGKAKKADRAPTQKRVRQIQAPPPTTEVLKDSPCGNPDWAKPPGSAGVEPVDAEFRTTSRKKSENNKAEDDSENIDEEPQDSDKITDSPKKPAKSNK